MSAQDRGMSATQFILIPDPWCKADKGLKCNANINEFDTQQA